MLVKNKLGDVEAMHYGPAMEAVAAGTHVIVNVDEDDEVKEENAKASNSDAGKLRVETKPIDAKSDVNKTVNEK
jgi:hypothetical protein